MKFGKKPNAHLLSFISGFDPADLPPPLCHYQAIISNPKNIKPKLFELAKYLK